MLDLVVQAANLGHPNKTTATCKVKQASHRISKIVLIRDKSWLLLLFNGFGYRLDLCGSNTNLFVHHHW